MKKKMSLLSLVFAGVLSLSACGQWGAPTIPSSSAPPAASAQASKQTAIQEVSFTLPKSFGDGFSGVLTQEQKEKGYKSARQNEDGSLTYTLTREDHERLLKELADTVDQALAPMDPPASIKRMSRNSDFSNLTITVDKESYEKGIDSMVVLDVATQVNFYHLVSGVQEPSFNIEFKDASTGQILRTMRYPESFNQ